MNQDSVLKIKDTTANPAPLGLAGFGLTTVLLNIHNAGLFPLDTMIVAMGIFYGGLAQVIVGIMEWKKNNTFGTTAFTSYGLFWLTLVTIWLLPAVGAAAKPSATSMAFYLTMWGVFSTFLFVATFKLNRALQVVFGLVVALFFLLALANATGSHTIHTIAGVEGVICGLSALYTGMAQVINEYYGRSVLPLGAK
ncbi:MAG: acetate uptake transporter [Bacteroidales bacterium]|jgi:succinate-acetate transporter protein|nr:acetate uptake transporter [Bacteroidales bacterium]MBN2748199.1 acetate uptake transporter [Bacteroidales bacterium]MDX9852572.1 acetate uptake transporter [Tenuifilaceae bacterium]HPX06362.1 acetate uptake transporter [Tenuifilaceae bacterium]HQB76813.1 acetate uptake transporter [Tenuifilaceae bacterium]